MRYFTILAISYALTILVIVLIKSAFAYFNTDVWLNGWCCAFISLPFFYGVNKYLNKINQ